MGIADLVFTESISSPSNRSEEVSNESNRAVVRAGQRKHSRCCAPLRPSGKAKEVRYSQLDSPSVEICTSAPRVSLDPKQAHFESTRTVIQQPPSAFFDVRAELSIEDDMKTQLIHSASPSALLARLLDSPDLVRLVRSLDDRGFAALVRSIGVEDSGELVALATTEQLVAAFDEDLFENEKPGEREVFDRDRFVVWLEVLLEAGEELAAQRFTELSEDFVIRALSSIILVLDHDALLASMSQAGEEAAYADKALESCLSEELDGYLLISRSGSGWDAALSLILSLDRNHHALLVRILERCADMASEYVDDLDALTTVLSDEESLAEDVEAEREERRSRLGYVEPRAARSFLALSRKPLSAQGTVERDPVTRAYFRQLERPKGAVQRAPDTLAPKLRGLLAAATHAISQEALPPNQKLAVSSAEPPLFEAMRVLGESDPARHAERLEEIAYLTNVVIAGAQTEGARFRPAEAAEAVLATVAFGAELVAWERRAAAPVEGREVLATHSADLLFRKASSTLSSSKDLPGSLGLLRSRAELDRALSKLRER